MNCSFKVQGVLGLSIFVLVFPYPAVSEVGTGKPGSVGGYGPFVPDGLTFLKWLRFKFQKK
jgi:hypothetical protein